MSKGPSASTRPDSSRRWGAKLPRAASQQRTAWGSSGSAVDMVGCHDGLIVSNVFRHTEAVAGESGSGVQAKGGSSRITIRRNRFDSAGSRAVNLGGSTGLEFFRPSLGPGAEHWEARDLRVEGNTFRGSASRSSGVSSDACR